MPQPIPEKRQSALWDLHPIRNRPEAAAAMANALVVWNMFEWDLEMAYSLTLGFHLPPNKGPAPPVHPLAFEIFETLSGLGARLDLFEKSLAVVTPSLSPKFAKLRPKIRAAAGKRAQIAHGRWGVNEDYPNDIVLCPRGARSMRWNAKDFDRRAEEFASLRREFGKLFSELSDLARRDNAPGPSSIWPPQAHVPRRSK